MVARADSSGIMVIGALEVLKFNPVFMPHRGFHGKTHQERSSIDMVHRYNLIEGHEAPALKSRFPRNVWGFSRALSSSSKEHNQVGWARRFDMPPFPSLRTKDMEVPVLRWLMAERAVSAAITPKMGVGRCFLRVNRRELCSRPTQSLERLHHGNSRRAISRDGGNDRTIRTCGKGVWRKRDAPSCGMWEIYEWATCWRGRSGRWRMAARRG